MVAIYKLMHLSMLIILNIPFVVSFKIQSIYVYIVE